MGKKIWWGGDASRALGLWVWEQRRPEPASPLARKAGEGGGDGGNWGRIMEGHILTFSPLRPASPFNPGRPEGPWKEGEAQLVSLKHEISRFMWVIRGESNGKLLRFQVGTAKDVIMGMVRREEG